MIISTLSLLIACNGAQLKAPHQTESGLFGHASAESSAMKDGSADEGQGRPGDSVDPGESADIGSEKVVIPGQVAGSYLSCVYEQAPPEAPVERTQEVFCSVRSHAKQEMIDIYSLNYGIEWEFDGVSSLADRMLTFPLLGHRQYHARFLFTDLEPEEGKELLAKGRIRIRFTSDKTLVASGISPLLPLPYSWLRLDGGALPGNAFIGGGECNNTIPLGICRIARGKGLYPGKLTRHYLDPNFTRCLSTAADTPQILSASYDPPDPNQQNLPTDAMIIPQKNGGSSLRWVKAEAGAIPADALAAGRDENGKVLYLCRNLEAGPAAPGSICTNNTSGEPAPGYIAEGSKSCIHEYFGQARARGTYEILVLLPK